MNPFKAFGNAFQRLRHSRGFGVHSPFAYRFVTDVIRPGQYGYYAYDAIDATSDIHPRLASQAKWFVRTFIFIGAGRVILTPSLNTAPSLAAKALGIQFEELSKATNPDFLKGDFLIIDSRECRANLIESAVDSEIPVLALSPGKPLREIMSKPMRNGLLLSAGNKILLIPRKEMAYTSYKIVF